MDATTVQEIANQLGIGIDKVLQYLPSYAEAQFLGYLVPLIGFSALFVICLIGFLVSMFCYKKDKISCEISIWFAFGFGVAGVFALLVLIILGLADAGDMIGWQVSPELMLLQSLVG